MIFRSLVFFKHKTAYELRISDWSSDVCSSDLQLDPMYVNFTMSVDSLEQMRRAQSSGNVTLADPNKASVQITLPDGSAYGEPEIGRASGRERVCQYV